MCGRFTLTTNDYEAVAQALDADADEAFAAIYRPRFNIAPTDRSWVVCFSPPQRLLVPATWGMPGPRRGDEPIQAHINARSETAHELPAFAEAFWSGRCGVVADGFYEWTGPRSDRQPIWFHRPRCQIVVFAGLFRDMLDATTGEVTRRFTILTAPANPIVSPYHDRMPAILAPRSLGDWLRPTQGALRFSEIARLRTLLAPAPEELLVATEVSKRVSDTRNDDPACIEPHRHQKQQTLF